MHYDYLIIGGGIASVSAAEAIRSVDAQGSIGILSRESGFLYSRVLLPRYVRGSVEREKVFLRTPDHYARFNIDLHAGISAVAVNFDTQQVHVSVGGALTFGKLLIAAGGMPRRWNIPINENDRVVRLHTIDDADRARTLFQEAHERKQDVLLVGGGFISLEFIGCAVAYGLRARCFIRERKFFDEWLDEKGWNLLYTNLAHHGVEVSPETELKELHSESDRVQVVTAGGDTVEGGFLGLGIGIERNYGIFQGTGVEVQRGIVVDQFLQTAHENVWAAGDIAEYFDVIFNEHRIVNNWTSAFLQGRTAGMNMAAASREDQRPFQAVSVYSITSLGFQITFLGRCEAKDNADNIVRTWEDARGYERIFCEGGTVKGAVLINRFSDKTLLARFIESKEDISSFKNMLWDPNYDIKNMAHAR